MATKNRVEGAEAVVEFIRDTKLPFGTEQDVEIDLLVSAKAGDKWRLTKAPLTVDFRYNNGAPEVVIESIGSPFYRAYGGFPGTRFIYDMMNAKLIIEGNLNKGRGDPYEIGLYRKRPA